LETVLSTPGFSTRRVYNIGVGFRLVFSVKQFKSELNEGVDVIPLRAASRTALLKTSLGSSDFFSMA
jgi:hypothetical protein